MSTDTTSLMSAADNTATSPQTAAAAATAAALAAAQAVRTSYPAQYYALYDRAATEPAPVTGWIDAWSLSDTSWLPAASQMLPLTSDQWAARAPTGQAVQGGAIVAYTPPVPTLVAQAQAAMGWVNQQASLASAMGETFGAAMKAYVQGLQAIIGGTDKTSTALPAAPAAYTS